MQLEFGMLPLNHEEWRKYLISLPAFWTLLMETVMALLTFELDERRRGTSDS